MPAFARQLALAQDAKGPPDTDDLDVRVSNLTLDVVRRGAAFDAQIQNVISDGYVEQTMQGASELSVQVLDRDYSLIQSESLGFKIDSVLDDVPFRLVQVSLQEDFNVTLTFEHRVVSWLREHSGPLKASRGAMTRAEFVYRMVREVQAGPIRFVSPELHVRQPIAKATQKPSKAHKDATRAPGFADGVKLNLAGAPAKQAQLAQVDRAMRVAASLQASKRATLAMIVAGIGESFGFHPVVNSIGYGGVFQGDVSHRYHYFDRNDTEGEAHYFLVGGKGFQGGGAIALAREHPDWSPGQIATTVEASGQPASFYDKWRKEADAIINAWSGGGAGDSFGAGGSYYAKFEFTRGVNGQREDSWTCIQRLANDVRWRAFVAGRESLFFCTDDDLMQSRPRYLIDPTTSGVQSLTFDVEVGGRVILVRGVRTPRPSQMTLMARDDRWAAPPGTVIQVDDYGPANGRWLVDTVRRPLFDDLATITLRQPQKALPEPRSQFMQRSGSGTGVPGKVKVAAGANRPGVGLHKPLLQFLALVAGQLGSEITVTTGTNHNQYVLGTHNQSDHWTGDAADIGVGGDAHTDQAAGRKGDDIATAALVVLGVPEHQARSWAQSGALDFGPHSNYQWRGHRVQVGWRTYVGGNHYNHVHIGVR